MLLHYGGGSVKRSGLYDAVCQSLNAAGISFCELGGVRPNPDIELVREGVELCRSNDVQLVLAVGGGSAIDSAKAIALGVPCPHDVWEMYATKPALTFTPLPVATILTLPAAGSENSINSVINNNALGYKLGYGAPSLRPVLSLICPELFLTLPAEQMAYGACDMHCHVLERYFSPTPHCELTDALCEATQRTIMQQSRLLRREPQNVEAWGQLALSGTIAHNNILGIGRAQSWACHAMEHELSAAYDVPHGAGLAVIVPHYLRYVSHAAPALFAQWAVNVMGLPANRDRDTLITQAIDALQAWYTELGLPRTMQELGIPDDADFDALAAKACAVRKGPLDGVLPLQAADAAAIYRAALG